MMRYKYRCCCGGLGGVIWKDVLLDVQSIVLGVPANLNDITDESNMTDVHHVHMVQYIRRTDKKTYRRANCKHANKPA
jgi:hypothetical protein